MRKFALVSPLFLLLLSCGGKKVAVDVPASTLDEPDRVLYERAKKDIEKNRFTVARLSLQTLINTYPDSELLAPAKYAMAESFFRENSSSSLSQAENEFKDYITFFPVNDLADDAQLKIAMTHIRRMEKHDRDNTQARLAEIELKSMIDTYPDSPLLAEAKRDLRAVQEVLADYSNGIGNFYMLHKNWSAAISRYKEVMTKYPDYSNLPSTLFNLAEGLKNAGNESEAVIYYARVVMEHPLSNRTDDAKQRLTALNQPVPNPSAVALARAPQREERGVVGKVFGLFKSRPPVPTDTAAASDPADANSSDDAPTAPVRGGTGSGTSNSPGPANNNGTFSLDPKVINNKADQTKKP
jgi:outer membrane protein assembly factor BamD